MGCWLTAFPARPFRSRGHWYAVQGAAPRRCAIHTFIPLSCTCRLLLRAALLSCSLLVLPPPDLAAYGSRCYRCFGYADFAALRCLLRYWLRLRFGLISCRCYIRVYLFGSGFDYAGLFAAFARRC